MNPINRSQLLDSSIGRTGVTVDRLAEITADRNTLASDRIGAGENPSGRRVNAAARSGANRRADDGHEFSKSNNDRRVTAKTSTRP